MSKASEKIAVVQWCNLKSIQVSCIPEMEKLFDKLAKDELRVSMIKTNQRLLSLARSRKGTDQKMVHDKATEAKKQIKDKEKNWELGVDDTDWEYDPEDPFKDFPPEDRKKAEALMARWSASL